MLATLDLSMHSPVSTVIRDEKSLDLQGTVVVEHDTARNRV